MKITCEYGPEMVNYSFLPLYAQIDLYQINIELKLLSLKLIYF